MAWKIKFIEDNGIDDNNKQTVVGIIVDEETEEQIDGFRSDFYGDPEDIKIAAIAWREKEEAKQNVVARKINVGDLI